MNKKDYYKNGIYFITGINPKIVEVNYHNKIYNSISYSEPNPTRTKTIGWYNKLSDAIKAVLDNEMDIHEDEFKYVVIEKYPEGACPVLEEKAEVAWFMWVENNKIGYYVKHNKPSWSKGTCNWAF